MTSMRTTSSIVLFGGFLLLYPTVVTSYGLCGEKLVRMVMDICQGCVVKPGDQFFSPKRFFIPFLQRSRVGLLSSKQKRSTLGLSDRCCTGTCSFNDLQSYCETDTAKCKPIRRGG